VWEGEYGANIMYKNGKMGLVQTIPGMAGGINEKDGGMN
jgi:hypothetical protein